MPWVKLDDKFLTNPKVMRAGLNGRALYVAGLCYCAGGLTDGHIPREVIAKLGTLADVRKPSEAVARLLGAGLWEATDDGYAVHDYLKYQPSATEVRKEREGGDVARAQGRSRGYATVQRGPGGRFVSPLDAPLEAVNFDRLKRGTKTATRPGPSVDGPVNDLVSPARARAPDEPAARRALADEEEPARLPNGATQCPMCPDVFTGSYADHMAGPRHRVREIPEDFKRRRSPPTEAPPPEVAAELAALRSKPSFDPTRLPPDVLAEHERRLQLERSGGDLA